MKRYSPTDIEQKWQVTWEQNGTYTVDLADQSRPKYYGFSMLPGITGAGIHTGHGRTFQFSDIKVRAKRQQGYNAYHPIGWDSFGLPVENYAIKVGKKPREAHDEALVNFKKQLKRLGYSYDWTKEISTADPEYYKWTQWIFNQLYKNDLAYQKESPQWWCEHDQTVLANEQVEAGKCWRCGNPVVKKNLKQWFFKITEYADEILDATDDLDWTEMVKTMQKNWIGRSQGAEIEFTVDGHDDIITVFSTRPDTLFGATFLVLAPEHELSKKLATGETRDKVTAYIEEAARKSEIERMNESRDKTGVFSGSFAINPANGERIPIWIADYVLAGYGTGAIMAVPAHDERDYAFAEKFGIPIVTVVEPEFGKKQPDETKKDAIIAVLRDPRNGKVLVLDWGERKKDSGGVMFVGGGIEEGEDTIEAARREITEETGYTNFKHIANTDTWINNHFYSNVKQKNYHARFLPILFELDDDTQVERNLDDNEDQFTLTWIDEDQLANVISEPAHYHGYEVLTTSNILHSEGVLVNSGHFNGMASSEAREEVVAWLEEQGTGRSKTTYKMRDWLISRQRYWGAPIPIIHCPDHGAVAVPDDQLPVILPDVDDYTPKGGAVSVLASVEDWVNVACPTCGKPAKRETDTLDGYACSSWYFLRYIDPFNSEQAWSPEAAKHWEPVDFYNGGDHAVAHLLYSRFWMRFFYKQGLVPDPEPFKRMMYNGYILAPDGTKMSKSKGNTIDPLEIMDSGYGADSLRVYEMFIAPYDLDAPWDTRGVPGTYRFLNRVWTLVQEYLETDDVELSDTANREILAIAHKTIKKVTSDIEDDKFNTAVSSMMEAVNAFFKLKETHGIGSSDTWKFALESLLQVLAPFAPHITEELWADLGHDTTIHKDNWPQWDNRYLQSDVMTVIVQVNGKVRAKLELAKDTSEEAVKQAALQAENVAKFIGNEKPTKVIYIPGRLVNIVI
jgi:leucyl-tRNA synthetase